MINDEARKVSRERYYAIPDIHAEYSLLEKALFWIYTQPKSTIIFLGDYIDRGNENVKVLDTVIEGKEGWEFIPLRGNHEEMFSKNSPRVYDQNAMLEISKSRKGLLYYQNWMRGLKYFHIIDNNVFVHAYFNPQAYEYGMEQDKESMVWDRMRDSTDWRYGCETRLHLTHGHTPRINGPLVAPARVNLDCGANAYKRLVVGIYERGVKGPVDFREFRRDTE